MVGHILEHLHLPAGDLRRNIELGGTDIAAGTAADTDILTVDTLKPVYVKVNFAYEASTKTVTAKSYVTQTEDAGDSDWKLVQESSKAEVQTGDYPFNVIYVANYGLGTPHSDLEAAYAALDDVKLVEIAAG